MQCHKDGEYMTFLIVLGSHRSGTSALTGVLVSLGFTAGRRLMPPNQFNERGYFEDVSVSQCNEALLQKLGRSWRDERLLPLGWATSGHAIEGSAALGRSLREGFDLSAHCVLKDPRLCRLLPVVERAFGLYEVAPKYVISLRTPYAVVPSLTRRDGIAPSRAALLYLAYLLEAERETRGKPRVFVQYESLLADWRTCVGTIAQELKVPKLAIDALPPGAIARAQAFLSPELNHAPQALAQYGGEKPMQMALAVYECLCTPGEHSTTLLDALYIEWKQYLEGIEPWLSEAVAHEKLMESLPRLLWEGGDRDTRVPQQSAFSFLLWASASKEYCGENTKRLTWQFNDDNQHRYVLPLCPDPITGLRWDITECPAFCRINRLWIEDATGAIVWNWDTGEALLAQPSPDLCLLGVNDENVFELISIGMDPYGVIQVPPTVLAQLKEGWAVCADWRAFVPTQGIKPVLARLMNLMDSLSQTQRKLQGAQESLDVLKRESANESQALRELQQQRNQVRTEIIRAEAQIEMLKELLLGDS